MKERHHMTTFRFGDKKNIVWPPQHLTFSFSQSSFKRWEDSSFSVQFSLPQSETGTSSAVVMDNESWIIKGNFLQMSYKLLVWVFSED